MINKVKKLIEVLKTEDLCVEAISFYQNGEMLLEHRFVRGEDRLIYSHTKSFVSTLAGIAVDQGKITLDTTLLSLFPEYENIIVDERAKDITLRHFLTMSSGFGKSLLMSVNRRKGEGLPDYMEYVLSHSLEYNPGEKFCYSNADSHMVCCMLQRVLDEHLLKFANRELFAKMDMGYPVWETDPNGVPFGGSGMYLTISDMMKLGILYLNKGKWNGEQIVSEKWVNAATAKRIETGHPDSWNSGYGYQFWQIEAVEGAYRADGAYGQYSIVLPKENAVLATQCSEYNNVAKFAQLLRKYVIE